MRVERALITVKDPKWGDRTFPIGLGRHTVGRGLDQAIQLPDNDRGASRRHAILDLREDGLFVEDLGSRNGTFVDDARIPPNEPTHVPVGSTLAIARNTLVFELAHRGSRLNTGKMLRLLTPLIEDHELVGKIGTGANGSVWAAIDRERGRHVAIKVLHQQVDAGSEDAQRFIREAQAGARIDSPHVVEVYELRVLGSRPVILMELVLGMSALQRLNICPRGLPDGEVLRIGEEMARALVAMHEAGVVHRDVKPSNILLGDGSAKLSDFGLAKATDARSLTGSDLTMGTLAYMAPEQILSTKSVDYRADVYALGATLYHLLARRPPLDVHDLPFSQLVQRICGSRPKPVADHRPDCPRGLVELLDQMLEKDPGARVRSPEQLLGAFTRLRAEHKSRGLEATD